MQHFLVALTGARDDVLRQTPVDRPKYVAMGAVILTTACLAALSAFFALTSAARFPVAVGVAVGLAWGVVILNLDRMLVVGMTRQEGLLRNTLSAVPRLLLALIIGAVMSTPLVLQIFAPEIRPQVELLKNQHQAEFVADQQNNQRFAQIPALTQQWTQAQSRATQSNDAFAVTDPGVVRAQAEVDDLGRQLAAAQSALQCELDGTRNSICTGVPGEGSSTAERRNARDFIQRQFQDASGRLALARENAVRSADGARAEAATNATQLRSDLDARIREKQAADAAYDAQLRSSGGLLDQIQALSALSDTRPELALAQRTLFLLFLALEMLPVLVKLLQLLGKPSLYDEIIERMDREARARSAYDAAVAREQEQDQRDTEAAVVAQRLAKEREEGLRLATEQVETEARRARERMHAG